MEPEWLETGLTAAMAIVVTPFALRAVYHAWPLRALPGEGGFSHMMRIYFNWGNAVLVAYFLWASVFGGYAEASFGVAVLAFVWGLVVAMASAGDHRRAEEFAQKAQSAEQS
jgi:hypothetical protein